MISTAIVLLVQKRLQSEADDEFEAHLVKAEGRSYLRAFDLDVLIQSRGIEPNAPDTRKKKLEVWMALKDASMTWKRTVNWMWCNKEDLLELQASLG